MTCPARHRKPKAPPQSEAIDNTGPTATDRPVFAQPEATADPTRFKIKHPSDDPAYKEIDELNREHKIQPLPFPAPRGGIEPQLTLSRSSAATQLRSTKSPTRARSCFTRPATAAARAGHKHKAWSPTKW